MRGHRYALAFVATLALGCGAARRPDGGTGLLPAGSVVPDLSAPDQSGKVRTIKEEQGHPLIVYFYPKDGTPGCTREACAFRDAWDRYKKAGVQIYGVSADDQKSHEQFAKEQHLPFPIVADPAHAWSLAFGVSSVDAKSHEQFAKEQHLPFPIVADPGQAWSGAFGVSTKLGMDSRVSFLIDGSGKVARVYPDVDPGLHADEVLKDAATLAKKPSL